jgi:hypothetical protein
MILVALYYDPPHIRKYYSFMGFSALLMPRRLKSNATKNNAAGQHAKEVAFYAKRY